MTDQESRSAARDRLLAKALRDGFAGFALFAILGVIAVVGEPTWGDFYSNYFPGSVIIGLLCGLGSIGQDVWQRRKATREDSRHERR